MSDNPKTFNIGKTSKRRQVMDFKILRQSTPTCIIDIVQKPSGCVDINGTDIDGERECIAILKDGFLCTQMISVNFANNCGIKTNGDRIIVKHV